MKHRILSAFLTILLLASLLVLPVSAASDSCGEGLRWNYDKSTATLTISGSGAMDDFTYASIPWSLHRLSIQHIVVESGVTTIGNNAFNSCAALVDVTLPDTVTAIGTHAFYGCSDLIAIDLPAGLTLLGNYAFAYCSKLTQVTIPAGVKTIGTKSFANCKGLTVVKLNAGLEIIGSEAFTDCSALTEITLPAGVTEVGQYAFANCEALSALTLPESLTAIGYGAFSSCSSLKTVVLPHNLQKLGTWAFHRCTALETATLPAGIASIPANCFSQCSALQSITLYAETTTVERFAFNGCSALTDIYYTGTRAQYAALTVETGNDALTAAKLHPTALCSHQLTTVAGKAATCTESGISDGSRCTVCGEDIVLQTVIPPLGHPDTNTDYRCDVCDKNLCEVHRSVPIEAVEATCTQTGKTAGTKCELCGRTLIMPERIPMLSHDYVDGVCTMCGKEEVVEVPVVNPFTDVAEDAYYYDAVLWAVDKGITTGVSAEQFAPDATCTRAQVATFLWRAAGSPKVEGTENPFTDVAEGSYYYDAVLWCVDQGITTGTSDTAFSPDATCTRAQVAAFLWRSADKPAADSSETPFTDVEAGAYYYEAVLWAVTKGITTGVSAESFAPDATCTRGQIVTFLYRSFQ